MSVEPKPYDAGDSGDVRKAKRGSKAAALAEEATIRHMLGSEAARRIWWDLLTSCGVFHAEFVPAEHLQFLTGQRNIGLMLLAKVPRDLYKVMADEAAERAEEKSNA